jgi:xylitol oxidase
MGFTPSAGEELQSEYLVAREHAGPAIEAVRALADRIRPVLHVCEIRTIAADRLWMSPQYERDSVGIHFTWALEPEAVMDVLADLEPALEPFDPRPHWGKLFLHAPRYERVADFARLADRLDPRGAFSNGWLQTRVLGLR